MKLVHFVRQQKQVLSFGEFETGNCFSELGFWYAESGYFPNLACTFYTVRTSSLIDYCHRRQFYAIEFSAPYQIQRESGEEVALSMVGPKTQYEPDRPKSRKMFALRNTNVVGGSYGRCTMVCRTGKDFTGLWGAPAMCALEGGSAGKHSGKRAEHAAPLPMT